MLYFGSDGTPLNFSPNVGALETPGDQGGPKPLKAPGAQISPNALKMQTITPATPSATPLSAPQGGAQIDPQMIMSLKNIIQNRQYASAAQQANSPAYQDPNLMVGPQTPNASQIPPNSSMTVDPSMPSSTQLLNSQGMTPTGINPTSGSSDPGGGGMAGGMGGGGAGLGMAVAGMLQNAAKQDQANAQTEMGIVSKGAQSGTMGWNPAQFGTVDLSMTQDPNSS